MKLDFRCKKGSCVSSKICLICGCGCGPSRNKKIIAKIIKMGDYKEESNSDDAHDIPITGSDNGACISEQLTVLGLQ